MAERQFTAGGTATDENRVDERMSTREFRDRYAPRFYLWTWHVTQLAGAYLAPRFLRAGIRPNAVSIASALTGMLTSVAAALLFDSSSAFAGIVALLGWQLAYTLDYTDGQMARAAGLVSNNGAVLDLLCDHLFQAAIAVAVVHIAFLGWHGPQAGTIQAIAALALLLPFVHGISFTAWRTPTPGSAVVRRSRIINLVKQSRDHGVQIGALAIAIAFGSMAVLGVVALLCAMNLAAASYNIFSLARSSRPS
jgi:phosphatidylglycerophosphate synthase